MSDSRIRRLGAAADRYFRTIVSILNPRTPAGIMNSSFKNSFCCTVFVVQTEVSYCHETP
jgi:hypothetical protein